MKITGFEPKRAGISFIYALHSIGGGSNYELTVFVGEKFPPLLSPRQEIVLIVGVLGCNCGLSCDVTC